MGSRSAHHSVPLPHSRVGGGKGGSKPNGGGSNPPTHPCARNGTPPPHTGDPHLRCSPPPGPIDGDPDPQTRWECRGSTLPHSTVGPQRTPKHPTASSAPPWGAPRAPIPSIGSTHTLPSMGALRPPPINPWGAPRPPPPWGAPKSPPHPRVHPNSPHPSSHRTHKDSTKSAFSFAVAAFTVYGIPPHGATGAPPNPTRPHIAPPPPTPWEAPSSPPPHVGLDGVGRRHRLDEPHGVSQPKGDVLWGPGGGLGGARRREGSMGAAIDGVRSWGGVGGVHGAHRLSTTTTAAPSGRRKAVYSRGVFLDFWGAMSPTRWEPSGMNLLRGQRGAVRPGVGVRATLSPPCPPPIAVGAAQGAGGVWGGGFGGPRPT